MLLNAPKSSWSGTIFPNTPSVYARWNSRNYFHLKYRKYPHETLIQCVTHVKKKGWENLQGKNVKESKSSVANPESVGSGLFGSPGSESGSGKKTNPDPLSTKIIFSIYKIV